MYKSRNKICLKVEINNQFPRNSYQQWNSWYHKAKHDTFKTSFFVTWSRKAAHANTFFCHVHGNRQRHQPTPVFVRHVISEGCRLYCMGCQVWVPICQLWTHYLGLISLAVELFKPRSPVSFRGSIFNVYSSLFEWKGNHNWLIKQDICLFKKHLN